MPQGLKIEPRRGSAVLFYSLRPDGVTDPFSLHGGCPPLAGTKWAVNKWLWSRSMADYNWPGRAAAWPVDTEAGEAEATAAGSQPQAPRRRRRRQEPSS